MKSIRYKQVQLIMFLWVVILLLPLLFSEPSYLIIARATHLKMLCHQLLDRFFEFNGHFPLVCTRCLGIYIGLLFLSFIKLDKIGKYTFLGFLSTIIDKSLETFFDIPISNEIRFFSGILFALPFVMFLQVKLTPKSTRETL